MFHVKHSYEVVVVGGGHAGCEAALASARMGCSTLLITMDPGKIGEMSCNPSIGGVGKGQLVREIDALGGEMGKNADFTGIQFKRLNTRKGSAVQSSRCQADKRQYALRMQTIIREQEGLDVLQGEVKSLLTQESQITGLTVSFPDKALLSVNSESVVITAGTFMRGLMHCGSERSVGGRAGETSSVGLSDALRTLGFPILRLKTGTPPRLFRDSIDFSQMERQEGDLRPRRFSFSVTSTPLPQVPCFLTYTSPETHSIIRANLETSPLYSGQIKGIGPRYCPSIEDKVVKFPEKPRHQLFFEPESLDSDWIYPNGISTSLSPEVQEAFVRSLPGCSQARFARYGYAVEYDCIDPRSLQPSLESRPIAGLYFAGQVNGTSGYEEAAAQGIMAGINSALRAKGKEALILDRSEAYIGVMINDLTTLGITEPYRMFTSRAEYRLSLREDNADLRLTPYGRKLGLINDQEHERFRSRYALIEKYKVFLERTFVKPSEDVQRKLASYQTPPVASSLSLLQLLKRPELGLREVLSLSAQAPSEGVDDETAETIEIQVKYAGYVDIQKLEIERLRGMKDQKIPESFDFRVVVGLSFELREKMSKQRPETLADAARISGVTPAALAALLFHIKHRGGSASLSV